MTASHANKIDEMYSHTKQILQYAKHLENLDKLNALESIREYLMPLATGKDQMQTKTANIIFRLLGAVILGLLSVIIFLLTGAHMNIIEALHR